MPGVDLSISDSFVVSLPDTMPHAVTPLPAAPIALLAIGLGLACAVGLAWAAWKYPESVPKWKGW